MKAASTTSQWEYGTDVLIAGSGPGAQAVIHAVTHAQTESQTATQTHTHQETR